MTAERRAQIIAKPLNIFTDTNLLGREWCFI